MNLRFSDTKKYLTYSYDNYNNRQLLYEQVVKQLYTDLTPNSKELTAKQRHWAEELDIFGSCKIENLPNHLLSSIQNLIKPTHKELASSGKYIIPDKIVYNDSNILKCASNPDVIRAIQSYLGVFPSIQYISMWSNYGFSQKRTNEMYWHFDHHGHKFIKLFFYLNNTPIGFGHHEYINRTHKQDLFDQELSSREYFADLKKSITNKRRERGNFRIDDDIILPLSSRLKKFTGQEGFAFMEDTRGLHRGTLLPPETTRHILQILYVPFDSGKDVKPQINLDKGILNDISQESNFKKSEIEKLFCLLS